MKNRIVSLLLALALLVLPVVSAGAAQPAAAETVPVQTRPMPLPNRISTAILTLLWATAL